MEGDYSRALQTMQLAVQAPNSVSALGWRALALMTYLYGSGPHKGLIKQAIPMLDRAIELSGAIDTEAMLMKGQMLMELNKNEDARECFKQAMTLTPGMLSCSQARPYSLAAIGFRAPVRATQADYDAKFQDMNSLGALNLVEDPELLFMAAVNPNLSNNMKAKVLSRAAGGHGIGHVANGSAGPTMNILGNPRYDPTEATGRHKPTLLSSSSQLRHEPQEVTSARTASGVSAGASAAVAAAARDQGSGSSSMIGATKIDVATDVLYWYGMHKLGLSPRRGGGAEAARIFFTRAVQRTDCPPHPLALYMLGWLAELQGDLVVAERYYCYSMQLEPVDPCTSCDCRSLQKTLSPLLKDLRSNQKKLKSSGKRLLRKRINCAVEASASPLVRRQTRQANKRLH